MRSQRGPLVSALLTALVTSRMTRIEAQPFRLLLCRLRFPLPLSLRSCRCGRQFDSFRAACHVAGVLGKREYPLECAATQVCREAGARVTTSRHGPGPFLRTRCSKTRSFGRRAQTLARGTAVEGRWHASDRRRPTPNSVRSGPLGGVGRRGWRLMGRRDCSVHHRAGECAGGVGALHPQRSDGCSMDPPVECNACVQRCRNIRFVSDGPTPRAGHW